MTGRVTPHQLAQALGLPPPTDEQAAVIAAPPGPTLVVAGAGAGKTETMAARVVWMVANGLVLPDEVLGLTFTRKAAQQLTARIRTRLARLAGAPLLRELDPSGRLRAQLTGAEPEISTYHSYAGRLLTEHGLLLPVEPSAALLTETQLWQLAHQVVRTWDGDLETERTPVSVTEAVLALSGQLAEHLVEPEELAEAHTELAKLVHTLPAGPRQRGGPSQTLLNIVQVQRERVALLPLVQQLSEALRRRGALDFGAQMSLAARLAAEHPEVAAAERARFRLVLLDEYQDTGHAQRVLLAALFGGAPEGASDRTSNVSGGSASQGEPGGSGGEWDALGGGASAREPYGFGGSPDVSGGSASAGEPDGFGAEPDLMSGGAFEGQPQGGDRGLGRSTGSASVRDGAQEMRLEPSTGQPGASVDDARDAAADRLAQGSRAPQSRMGKRDPDQMLDNGSSQAVDAPPGDAARGMRRVDTGGAGQPRFAGAHDPHAPAERRDQRSQPHDAQRLAVTAVGDPMQSIYGWRGASAANLPRFATDFPTAPGVPAPTLALLTSWRNPPEALALANSVAEPLRRKAIEGGGVTVDALRAKPEAGPGVVALASTDTVAAERDWVAERIAAEWAARRAAQQPPPTSAVLVRRNADAAPLAEALRAQGLPVEIVGLGGLLATPEVADIVATLRLIAEPGSGSAAMRVLTGARWRIGVADIAALNRRARDLSIRRPGSQGPAEIADGAALDEALREVAPEPAEQAGLADAIADPGPPDQYSSAGFARIEALGRELSALRERSGQPLAELVADVERTIGVGVETQTRRAMAGTGAGREHLDAFAEVVAGYAADTGASLGGLLAFLAAAEEVENGLEPGEVEVAKDRVQVLTVHAAKGLEWEIVAVPHVVEGVFPSKVGSGTWLGALAELPTSLRGDRQQDDAAEGVPVLDLTDLYDRADLDRAIKAHKEALERRRIDEERRLFYVALTRTERVLLVSAHHWAETGSSPKGPSDFLLELKRAHEDPRSPAHDVLTIDRWDDPPAADAVNPFTDNPATAEWPRDPLSTRRDPIEQGAALVRAALAELRARPADAGRHGPDASGAAPDRGAGPGRADPGADPAGVERHGPDVRRTAPNRDSAFGDVDSRAHHADADADADAGHCGLDVPGAVPDGGAGPGRADSHARPADAGQGDPDSSETSPGRAVGSGRADAADAGLSDPDAPGIVSDRSAGPDRAEMAPPPPDEPDLMFEPDYYPPDNEYPPDEFADDFEVVATEYADPYADIEPYFGTAPDPVEEYLSAGEPAFAATGFAPPPPEDRFRPEHTQPAPVPGDPEGWAADVDALLAEHRAAAVAAEEVELPGQIAATALVELRADPARLAARLRRPLPYPPNPLARRGTAFHAWVQRWFGSTRLLGLDELPGAADSGAADAGLDAELTAMQEAFLNSRWADRSPIEVEIPFETSIAGTVIRGRMDAVFAEPGGRWTVVDWKTGAEPSAAEEAAVAMQLAVYRLAWARLMAAREGRPEHEMLDRIGAAFHYVRTGRTIAPVNLAGPEELAELIRNVAPAGSPPAPE
ncbi:UvrD-helicase domain-containing protein [Nocardia gamkensis]|uniref:UvrD-helicase domain-containing protein n=1 Tax=Nocardia gamkensis TaxID=352869 RepID=UPI000A03DE1C|nr:UvrD-helicase domain-containing protein [Nocardia gamkensis]NQE71687.1 ATP-dependent DNA helicase PcrA [Nocardia gamkensis]